MTSGSSDRQRVLVLRVAVVVLGTLAVLKLGTEFYRLLVESGPTGAIDLRLRYSEVQRWFAGQPIYGVFRYACYPPATNVLLWPFIGWLDFTLARWVWAASTVAAIGWLIFLIERDSGASTRLERVFVMLLPLSVNATGVAVGNGQLPLHLLPLLIAGMSLLVRARGRWLTELGGAALILAAFVKPTFATPFFWLVLFVPGTFRPAVLVVAGYAALTMLAASFQPAGVVALMREWFAAGVDNSKIGALQWSYGDLHTWTVSWGLEKWNPVLSLLTLAGLGVWTFFHRRCDLWLLLGVTGVVARLWTYHGIYDDVLILLPMVALFRITKQQPPDSWAGRLLAITTLTMLLPVRLWHWPPPWCWTFTIGHVVIWLAVLIFLIHRTRRV